MESEGHGGRGRGGRPGGARDRGRGERAQCLGSPPRRRSRRPARSRRRPPPRARPRRRSRPSPPSPTPLPTATPLPTPVLVPAPLTGRLVTPAVAAQHPDRGDDRRPRCRRGPSRGSTSASVVWQAPAEGGIPRYMAIFQETLPSTSGRSAAPATTTSPGPRSGGRSTPTPVARRRRMATLESKGNGQYVYNADEFRCGGTFYRITDAAAPHNLYTTGAKLRATRQARSAPRTGLQAGLDVRAGRAARGAAVRRDDHRRAIPPTRSRYALRPDHQHLPPLGDRREEADRRGDRRGSPRRTSS